MAAIPELRADGGCSELIDRAVLMQQNAGSICALEYLKAHSVLPETITRVLLQPQRRRQVASRQVMHKNW